MEPLYYATSLEQIAVMFDRLKDQAEQRSLAAGKKGAKALYHQESITWREAANILRSTAMTKPQG